MKRSVREKLEWVLYYLEDAEEKTTLAQSRYFTMVENPETREAEYIGLLPADDELNELFWDAWSVMHDLEKAVNERLEASDPACDEIDEQEQALTPAVCMSDEEQSAKMHDTTAERLREGGVYEAAEMWEQLREMARIGCIQAYQQALRLEQLVTDPEFRKDFDLRSEDEALEAMHRAFCKPMMSSLYDTLAALRMFPDATDWELHGVRKLYQKASMDRAARIRAAAEKMWQQRRSEQADDQEEDESDLDDSGE